jgi:hypothetical protein
MFDMTKCKVGDKLISREGKVYTLLRKSDDRDYPYVLTGNNIKNTSRTVEGYFYTNNSGGDDYDIVGFHTDKVAKPKPKRIRKAKPVNKLLGLLEWVARQESPMMLSNGLYFYGTFQRHGVLFEYGYVSKQPYEATIGGFEMSKPVTVHTINNFKSAVTKLLKG